MKEKNSDKENINKKDNITEVNADNKADKKETKSKKAENKKDLKNSKKEKGEKSNKFIETIKKKWLIDGTKTFLLIAILIAIFIAISVIMKNLDLAPIDLTSEKLFTLTEDSKEQVKNIQDKVNIYFVGYRDDDTTLDLARQYTKVNSNISIEAVTATDRPDLANKYGIETGSQGIIIENGEKYKVLSPSELYTYDYTTYETISIAEEKLTAAIKSVTTEKIPKVYFLTGYSSFKLTSGMQFLNMYLQNEINEVESLDVLATGKIPDDCNTLVITTPSKDFDEIATNAIIDYINKGGNILWLNAATANKVDYPNVNKILALYGVNPFEVGTIRETETSKMVAGSPDLIMPEVQYSDVTDKIYDSEGVIFINATKINVADDETLTKQNVTKTELIKTSEKAYFRTNFSYTSNEAQDGEETGEFLVGAQFNKKIKEANEETGEAEVTSKLILYGENYFASDYQLTQSTQAAVIQYKQNKDLVLNSIAYLSDREEDITVRKGTGSITYTATEEENRIILAIITAVPVAIIIIGIVVWRIRRKKK